jgi:hypothetical protein
MNMTTQISTKLAALGIALMVNSTLIGGIAFLFDGQLHQVAPSTLVQGHVAASAGKVV